MSHKERAAEAQRIRAYLKGAESELKKLQIVPRHARKYPFDITGLAILSKAFALAKASLRLLASEYPDEAYGLSRSLVESATNLRFLTAETSEQDRRTHDFIKFAKADKEFWYHYALEEAKTQKEKAELRAYARQMGIADNPKSARQHWSGQGSGFVWSTTLLDHPLDGPVTLASRKKAHAVDYYQASAFVHCSLPAIDNYFVDAGVPFHVSTTSGHHEMFQSTLFTILAYVHSAIGYVLFGMNTDRPASLDSLFQKTLSKMKPYRMQHRETTRA
jgi:hypothetical protein